MVNVKFPTVKFAFVLAAAVVFAALTLHAGDGGSCVQCHDSVTMGKLGKAHLNLNPAALHGQAGGCAACHDKGTTAQHEEAGDPKFIRTFSGDSDDGKPCVACHSLMNQGVFAHSVHEAEKVSCSQCHTVHKDSDAKASCGGCHQDVLNSFKLPSRHPLEPGKMTCQSCHDPHSNTEYALKVKTRKNDLCIDCHPSQGGPFIFEHSPVNEDCGLCHSAHGSIANNLLVANEPALCLQCHELHFHSSHMSASTATVDIAGQTYQNPYLEFGMNRAMTTKCSTCHSRIHGSDSPSQSTPTGGVGLTR